MAQKKSTKGQKILGKLLGWLTDVPFGTDEMFNQLADIKKSYYLVEQNDKQFLVLVTDDFIESRLLSKKVTTKKFEIGDYTYKRQ